MQHQLLFIQGGGEDGYEEDKALVQSLRAALGDDYRVSYPRLTSDETSTDFGWPQQIGELINKSKEPLIIVAHSVGASLLIKYLAEHQLRGKIQGLFLLATPFWRGEEDWKQGLILSDDFADKFPTNIPLFLYHNEDDEVAPFADLSRYTQHLPQATVRKGQQGGHQFNNDLGMVAADIQQLPKHP